MNLKKELMKLEYGDTLEEKLKQIEEIRELKINNENLLNVFVLNLECKTLKDLKNMTKFKILKIEKIRDELKRNEDLQNSLEFSKKLMKTY